MIWFACNKCGKRHSRPESSAGTFVFCDCGQGNPVPWESTVEAAEVAPAAPAIVLPAEPVDVPELMPPPLPPLPRFDAVPVGEERVPPRPGPTPVAFNDDKKPERPAVDFDRDRVERGPRRRPGTRRRDPRFCLNHEDRPTEQPCADCGDGFCADCLVTLNSKQVCGPCKNFRVRKIHGPQRVSLYAVIGVILAPLAGPLAFCLLPVSESAGSPLIAILALLPQLVAVVLGGLALREIETDPRITGRGLALTTLVTASFILFLTLFLTLFGSR